MTDSQTTRLGTERIEITPHIRVLYGAKPDDLDWIGWAVWDDHNDEECAVYPTKEQAVEAAHYLAEDYANGR